MTGLKKKFIDAKDDLMGSLNKQKKLGAIIIGGTTLVLFSLFLIVPNVQANIRNSQIRSLVHEPIESKKVTFLDYKTMDKTIAEQKAITVLFSTPNDTQYAKVLAILKDKEKTAELNRGINIYPIVYSGKDVEAKYLIKATEPTLIFFENGKETNRFIFSKEMDLATIFVPEFNRLPTGGQSPLVQPPVASSSQELEVSTESTTEKIEESTVPSEQPVAEQEIIQE